MSILRVFPTRTTYTPTDDYVRVGQPDLLPLPTPINEVHVSCCFTWNQKKAWTIAEAWHARLPGVTIMLGGPGAESCSGGPFYPGRYVKQGVSISSRGCPNKCPWCLVPEREGKLNLWPICPGYIIQDNNCLAWPRHHFRELVAMLKGQKRAAKFSGGLEARRLKAWHVQLLRGLRIKELWFAADTDRALKPLAKAAAWLKDLRRDQKRCYVLAGYACEPIGKAEARLHRVFELGYMPFIQLYRAPKASGDLGRLDTKEWRDLRRNWSRPITILARQSATKGKQA